MKQKIFLTELAIVQLLYDRICGPTKWYVCMYVLWFTVKTSLSCFNYSHCYQASFPEEIKSCVETDLTLPDSAMIQF